MVKDEQIHWNIWGPEVFEQSRKSQKPVFLSISATWCHWCHVMDEEGFDHPEVIRRINRDFIPVRVDSDKRPDINNRYNMGGWPTVAILDSEGNVCTGATYLPTSSLLAMLSTLDKGLPARSSKTAPVTKDKKHGVGQGLDPRGVETVLGFLEKAFDPEFGGFGLPPKFPHPWIIKLLLKGRHRMDDPKWRNMASLTLDMMRGSELYDLEDGGFFRYATEGDWGRPHYEKLLETNTRMLSVYLDAYRVLKEPTYLATARGILEYLDTYLSVSGAPGFFGSQSADEDYYTLPEEERLDSAPPPLDKTIYADLNAEAASVLLKAGSVLKDEKLSRAAIHLTEYLWENYRDPEFGMRHCDEGASSLQGYLSDQVQMLTLLLNANESHGGKRYLDQGLELLETMNRCLWDEEAGGYRDLPIDPKREGILKMEMKPMTENALAAMALTRLSFLTGNEDHRGRAEKVLAFLSTVYKPFKHNAAIFAIALERFLNPPDLIVIVGQKKDKTWGRLIEAAHRMSSPWKVVLPMDQEEDFARIQKLGYSPSDKPRAALCRGRTCFSIVDDPIKLEEMVVPFS